VTIEFRVLGPLEVRVDGAPLALAGRVHRLILSLLLAHATRRVSTDRIADALWGDEPPDGAVHTLRVHISNLRRLLEPDHQRGSPWAVIQTVEDGYRINLDAESSDRDRFMHLVEAGRRLLDQGDDSAGVQTLSQALGLWRGAAFGELASEPSLEAESARLEELRLATLEMRLEADLRLGHHSDLVAELRDLVTDHPLRERFWGLLMLALYQSGRQAEALRAYRSLTRILGEELGIEPSVEIRELEERILLQDLSLGPAVHTPTTNLPTASTSFVGREQDVARVHTLSEQARLVTLTGPGGVGKTRLAIEAAAGITDRFRDGVWLVPLAALRDPALVGQSIAEVLHIDQQPDRPVEDTLAEQLHARSLLLILDNCEHLIDPTALLVDRLIRAVPNLHVWATSREGLGISGETRVDVSGLTIPPVVETETPLTDFDSVRLFIDRATAVNADLRIDGDTSRAVAQICRRLDGLPLAIELAAARVTLLSPTQIAAGLDDRFSLLTTGSRAAEPRQQTLEAAVSWSYDLLPETDKAMLRRLSVFRGTFDLDAVAAVCDDITDGGADTLDGLGSLVTKSLVMTVPSATGIRYELLETIRLYARAKLDGSGEGHDALDRHRRWFLDVAERAGPELRLADQLAWLQLLEAEHDNLRAVLERAGNSDDIETSLRIAGSIAWFWFLHSHLEEGWNLLEQLIDRSSDTPNINRVRVLIAAGQFAWEQSKDEKATEWLEEALDLARSIGSRTHTGWALAYLSLLATLEARWDAGERLAGEARGLFEETGNFGGLGFSMWVEAGASYLRSREEGHTATDPVRTIESLLDIARIAGDRNFTGHVLWSLGIVAFDKADYSAAGHHLGESLDAFMELGNKSCTGHTLDQVAWLALAQGEPRRAARLLAAIEALRERLGIRGHVFERRSWESCRRRVLEELPPSELASAWEDGRHLSLMQAVDDARRVIETANGN
jgi:predicted ATPase/DNA-binding SARP family transcriptional activator